jgi:hypothetical protein
MLISTFELLVKRQLPKEFINSAGVTIPLPTSPLSRPIIQGYFLSIANTTSEPAHLLLNFKAVTTLPGIDIPTITATFLDINGMNEIGDVIPAIDNAYKYPIKLAGDTSCLFILQPDILKAGALTDLKIELRGYADIELDRAKSTSSAQLLITPEHRGTFFRAGITNNTPRSDRQLGEIAYSLPTASGGSLFKLDL